MCLSMKPYIPLASYVATNPLFYKMFSFCYNDAFSLIPVCLSCFIVFPVFLDQYGNKYSLFCIISAFLLSKLISNRNDGQYTVHKADPSLVASWFGLLSQTSRLALACCGLGQLLTDYHGIEDATFHLFPAIPWLMPITITFILVTMVSLGLQPSNILKSSFFLNSISLISIFLLIGVYTLISIDKEIVVTISLERVDESFFIQSSEKSENNGINLLHFPLQLLVITTLSALNKKVNCDRIINCMKTVHTWWEPVTLAMTVSSLGLCLPDLFAAAQELLYNKRQLRKILTISKTKFNCIIIIGLICAGLIYFCSLPSLVMILGSSLLIQSAVDKLRLLLNISNDLIPINEFDECLSSEVSDEEGLIKTSNNLITNRESDTDGSSSDINEIVAEYKAQIKIMNADLHSEESAIIRMIFISRALIIIITILGLLTAYLVQHKNLEATVFAVFGLIFMVILHQWVVSKVESCENQNTANGLKSVGVYLVNIILFVGISKAVWFYLLIWAGLGLIGYLIFWHRPFFNRNDKMKWMVSIKESPPIFEMSCGGGEPNSTNSEKIIEQF